MTLKDRPSLKTDRSYQKAIFKLAILIEQLLRRTPSDLIIQEMNRHVELLNQLDDQDKGLCRKINKSYRQLTRLAKKEMKLYTEDYHQNLYSGTCCGLIGLPLGFVGLLLSGKLAFLLIALPVGIAVGFIRGHYVDRKVRREGRLIMTTA
ncbi:hypothetical protein [Persicobacter sp. CCB-QB2]|uniref:hypothetical protein n=1 Tax=Persicobacter sp. CCB-QB2 TaxID=1561025 RepID=UPI0006A9ADB0|nr:hypothetical protein [Persicobacter sp. CCB-QB2]